MSYGKWWPFCLLMLQENQVNTVGAADLEPYITRSSAAMVLNMQDWQVLYFHEEIFQPHVSF